VVIPGLIKLGYDPIDAHDYTVAACWEFIIPNKSFDIPNYSKVNFPKAIENAVNNHLRSCESFDDFLNIAKRCVEEECQAVAVEMKDKTMGISPYLSVFVDDCIERGLDVSRGGAVYNNYGAHGVGISYAADAIAAVKKAVFEDKKCDKHELVEALKSNFEGYANLRNYLLSCPKMGNNDDYVDCYAELLMDIFADVFSRYKNLHGGVLRPGTGSAMEYLWSASKVGATADGRYAKAPFSSSFSPSTIAKLEGPLSCIQSFTKHDLTNIINGGPLTMEIHDNTFRNPDGIKKVAALVKIFVDLGGHQLQLNSINREILLDAQKHPENHKNLIVRVWGWSGYFRELDTVYQDHVISRTDFRV
jgi:formate C-acetyltransferase